MGTDAHIQTIEQILALLSSADRCVPSNSQRKALLTSARLPTCVQVLIGRNKIENDMLSHKVAAKTDLWFHARGYPGSHTILRIPAGRCLIYTFWDELFTRSACRQADGPHWHTVAIHQHCGHSL